MTFIFPDAPTYTASTSWWQSIANALEPIDTMMRQPISRTIENDIGQAMHHVLQATTQAHMTSMPAQVQAQLIAALINIQTSFSARQAGERRQSAKYWRMAQVEWTLFEEMLTKEGIQRF
ncbi:MAG: hypothetical protein AAFR81_29080 [Chloroflexota bacterium]